MKQNPFFAVSKNWIIIAIKKGFYTNVFLSLTNGSFSVTNRIQTILIHVAIWLFYWGLELLVVFSSEVDVNFLELLMNMVLNTSVFYAILYLVFPRQSTKLQYGRLLLKLLVVWSIALWVKMGYTYLLEQQGHVYYYKISKLRFFLITNLFRFTLFTIYASFIWFFTTKNKLEKQLLEKDLEKQQQEHALLAAEHALLKAQVNPHFLFNTLSFIYSKSVVGGDGFVSKTVMLLSDVLRYSLQHAKRGEKIILNDEIAYIRKLLALQQLRFNGKCYVEIHSFGEEEQKQLPSFILITLFENALKHGDFQNINNPVRIQIRQTSDKICFTVANAKRQVSSLTGTESFGIGFSYIEKILEAFYKKKYILEEQQDAQYYKLELTILNP